MEVLRRRLRNLGEALIRGRRGNRNRLRRRGRLRDRRRLGRRVRVDRVQGRRVRRGRRVRLCLGPRRDVRLSIGICVAGMISRDVRFARSVLSFTVFSFWGFRMVADSWLCSRALRAKEYRLRTITSVYRIILLFPFVSSGSCIGLDRIGLDR